MTIKCVRIFEDSLNGNTIESVGKMMTTFNEYLKTNTISEDRIISVQLSTEPYGNRRIDVLYCFYRGFE